MSTTIQLISDTHLEFHRDHGREFLDKLPVLGDILVIAGDYMVVKNNYSMLKYHLTEYGQRYMSVIYVLGNHEYYRSSPEEVHRKLKEIDAELYPKYDIHIVLGQTSIHYDDCEIHCCSLWFDETGTEPYQDLLNDFNLIRDFRGWVTNQNYKDKHALMNSVREGDIVVTHHLPSYESVHQQYQGSPLNAFFVSDCEEIIRERVPALWMHGHSHHPCDYTLYNTRIVACPFGYPNENDRQQDYVGKVIEIDHTNNRG